MGNGSLKVGPPKSAHIRRDVHIIKKLIERMRVCTWASETGGRGGSGPLTFSLSLPDPFTFALGPSHCVANRPFLFTEFTEAAKVHSNDDGISRHRLAPFNAYSLTESTIHVGFRFQCN